MIDPLGSYHRERGEGENEENVKRESLRKL
jgi:hypothetical protein